MGSTGSAIFASILLGSPIALIAISILWRKAVNRARRAEADLLDLEPDTIARIEAAEAEAIAAIERVKSRFAGVTDLDAEKDRF